MKTLTTGMLFLVFAVVAGVVGVVVWMLWEVGTRAIDALDAIGPGLFEAGALVTFGVFVFVVIGGAVAIVRAINLKSRQVHHHDGLFPVLYHPSGYVNVNEAQAQTLAVMHMHRGARATSASVGKVLDWQPALPELPAPAPAALTTAEVVDVDPRTSPHWLLVGSTGSGKTVASYGILRELTRRNPCQTVICEPGGVNWAGQATATNTREIAMAIGDVHSELQRRQELLRAADVDHVQDLPEPLPYLVLVAEETESVLDDLKLQDKATRDNTIVALRSIARLGRKCGICLVAVTQAGSLDVFDSHVRKNVGNVLLFRSEHTVSETWRLAGVRLQDLAPGWAYSVRHGAMVSFPMVARPVLPQVAQPVQPVVGAIGTTNGIPVDNWPGYTGCDPVVAVVGGSGPVVQRLEPGRQPDPTTAAELRRLYAKGWSKTRLCQECWGYKDGIVWAFLDAALDGDL